MDTAVAVRLPMMPARSARHVVRKDDTGLRLMAALNQHDFILYQQRVLALRPGYKSYQAILIRFKEEEQKLLPPGTFFPILESSHLMHHLDCWMLNGIAKWVRARLKADPLSPATCSMNLSTDSLSRDNFPAFVRNLLSMSSIRGGHFVFELSEQDAVDHKDELERCAVILRPLGCRFGLTGYCGQYMRVETLKPNGISSVKLGYEIVRSIHVNEASYKQAREIQQSCDTQGVCTIAEFVELPETLRTLKVLGVHYAQGHGIAIPAPFQ